MVKSKRKISLEPVPAEPVATPSHGTRNAKSIRKPKIEGKHGSKQACVIAMLQSPTGATISAVMKATGWQQHSVRGFLAGTIRKRLRLKLNSKIIDGNRVYRVIDARSTKTNSNRPNRHKL
jgi:Protein of unknown function (DUF3489)